MEPQPFSVTVDGQYKAFSLSIPYLLPKSYLEPLYGPAGLLIRWSITSTVAVTPTVTVPPQAMCQEPHKLTKCHFHTQSTARLTCNPKSLIFQSACLSKLLV